jgi:hypothetical protein
MKKFTLFFANLYLTTSLLSASTTAIMDEIVDRIDHSGNIHAMVLADSSGEIIKISASDLNICDDSIAGAISYPRPLSVSDTLIAIKHQLLLANAKMVDIDLSSNTICDEGAGAIGRCLQSFGIGKIKELDISWNRITDGGVFSLVTELKSLLLHPSFEHLRITGNYGANIANLDKLFASFDQNDQEIIRSKIGI